MYKVKSIKLSTLFFISLIIILNSCNEGFFYNSSYRNQILSNNDSNEEFFDQRIVRPSKVHDADGDKIADSLSNLISGDIKSISDSTNALREGGKKVEVMISSWCISHCIYHNYIVLQLIREISNATDNSMILK